MDIDQTMKQAVGLHVSGKLGEAEQLYRQVLSVHPNYPDALHFLGVLAYNVNNLPVAKDYIQKAIALTPGNAACYTNMGNVCQKEGNFEESVPWYQKSLDLNPANPKAYSNLGVAFTKLDRLDEAVSAFNEAIKLDPNYAEAYSNLSETFRMQGQYNKSETCCADALKISENHVQTHWNLSILQLLKGNLGEGFKAYEWRWQRANTTTRVIDSGQRWVGQDLRGKTIFVYEEQGIGDTIQFMRYLPLISNMGGRVIFEVLPPLIRLVADHTFFNRLWVAQRDTDTRPTDRFDYHVPLMSVPGVMGTTLETIPGECPYLRPDRQLSEIWKRRIGADSRFKIGVVWAGHPDHENDRNRSVLLSSFNRFREMENVALYSLQKDKYEKWTDTDPAGLFEKDLGEEISDFADTAAIIENLDLVISVDTSVVHLAGALGKKTWTMLPFSPDWRWMLNRTDSPWYPSMRLFRQPSHGDWQSVFEDLMTAIFELV